MSDSNSPPPPMHARDYAFAVFVCVVVAVLCHMGKLSETSAARLIFGVLTLQAVLRKRTGVGGGVLAFGVQEAAGMFAEGASGV